MRNIYRYGLTMAMLLSSGVILAAPVSPDAAMQEAQAFRGRNKTYFKKAPAAFPQLSLAYTASGEAGNCFYVFNDNAGGFTIVSADDRLPQVIGFSENGEFDYARLPENMKWWLSQYSDEITAFLKEDPQIARRPAKRAGAADRKEIKPLLHTLWNQTEPYNNLCPIDSRTGQRSVTGCVATAMAQVMRHYEWPVHPTGSNAGYIFNGTTLDWANMLDDYKPGKYSAAEATAVAELMRQCGASVNMMYSSYSSGAYSSDVPVALYTYFDYDISMRLEWRDYHTMSEWNNIVYAELEANRPVYYSGNSDQGGHAFVCDGYLSNNYFHFNWGWGGYQDGYFLLNSLNPDSGGTGSYAGGYNANQTIITGVKKNTGDSDAHKQVAMLATGSFTYVSGNTFRITGSGDTDLMYNPLGYNIKVTMGLKFTNVDDPSKVTYSKASGTSNFGSYYGTPEIVASTPSLAAGTYHVTPAFYSEYGEWEDVQVPFGYQRYVTLKVEGGKNNYINEGAEAEGSAKLLAGLPQALSNLYCNAPKAYRVTISNVGEADFFGQVGLTLWYLDDLSADGDEEVRTITIPAGGSMDVDFFLPLTDLKAGNYSVSVIDNKGYEICESQTVNYPKGDFSSYKPGDVEFMNISPTFPTTGGDLGVAMEVQNNNIDAETVEFIIALLKASDLSEVTTIDPGRSFNFEGLTTVNVTFAPRALPIEPGEYYWVIRDKKGNWLSLPNPVKAYGPVQEEAGISYQVTDKARAKAMVVASRTSDYTGTVSIPSKLGGNTVTAVKANAFTFSDELTDLRLPAGVANIENGQFYAASKLAFLTVNAPNPPVLPAEAFAEGAVEKITLSTANDKANIYKRTEGWDAFNMSSWIFDFANGISGTDLLKDPATGTYYNPYYVNAQTPFRFLTQKPADKAIKADWDIDGTKGTGMFWGFVSLPALEGKNGTVSFEAVADTGVETILGEDEKADVFTPNGILILREAGSDDLKQLPAGFYIINGKTILLH